MELTLLGGGAFEGCVSKITISPVQKLETHIFSLCKILELFSHLLNWYQILISLYKLLIKKGKKQNKYRAVVQNTIVSRTVQYVNSCASISS